MIRHFVLEIIKYYLILTLVYTVISIIRMYVVETFACNKKKGIRRIEELMSQGRFRQYPIYDFDEVRIRRKRGVAKISVFPNDTGKKTRAVIVCPGGGYAHLCTDTEGFPIAARLNELGYTAFVLDYRAGLNCSSHAPMHDLARAVRFISDHADEFNVTMEDYILVGFSAGGNLCGVFGTEKYGYARYNAKKPGALILGYPWTNVNHWIQHPYWNIWIGLFGIWLSERGNLFMFGPKGAAKKENRESLCVQKWITKDYPRTYMFSGGNDVLVPSSAHTDVLAAKFDECGIEYVYDKYFGVPHGIGLGERTKAAGWLLHALRFVDSGNEALKPADKAEDGQKKAADKVHTFADELGDADEDSNS